MSDAPLHRRYAPSPALDNSPGDGARRQALCGSGEPENGQKEEDYDDEDLDDDFDLSQLERFMRDRRRARSLPAYSDAGLYEDNGDGRKRVKFADSMGRDLAIVKHYSTLEEPQIPSKVLSRFRSFPPPRLQDHSAAIGDLCDRFASNLSTAAPQQQEDRLVACFQTPAEEDLDRRLRRGRVALEKIAITQVGVRGHIRVLAAAEEQVKEVGVRYTFNDWLSHVDAQALPVPADCAEHNHRYRLFSFTMYTPPLVEPGAAVHFAVYLRTEQEEFWDNNDGENYSLRYRCAPGATASFVSAAFQST